MANLIFFLLVQLYRFPSTIYFKLHSGMMGGQPGGQMGGPVAPQPAAPAPEPVPLAPIPAQHIEIQVKRKHFLRLEKNS